MQIKQVSVLGGSGFVGSAVVAALQKAGYAVNVLTRRPSKAKHLILLPNVKVTACDIFDDEALYKALKGSDAVINLVGVLHQSKRFSFDRMHHQLPARLGKVCKSLSIKRFIQMSSLGANHRAPSEYQQSKAAGEKALKAMEGLLLTTFRPSVIFGKQDQFINLFATLAIWLPVILLAKPETKFQPVWVEDVADSIVKSLDMLDTVGQTYELAGPKVYTFRELIQLILNTLKVKRCVIGLNDTLSYFQAFLMELLPIKLMSRDNVKSMEVDNISQYPFPAIFDIEPTALETEIEEMLVDATPRGAYHRFRQTAAREGVSR